jgi:disulfide bond formation protein DsbB
LIERIPYIGALIIIIINYKFNHLEKYLVILLIFIFLAGTLISLYHLGIEQGFITESLVCDLKNSSKILSKEEILLQLQQKLVSCKDVTFKIFGFSLTTFNIIISLFITIAFTKIYLDYEKNK